ncbi:hypothetical protein [Brucella sp. IR073]|uniref:hypothetical protein n=1 Tax=unclassified Brucella TaxID=2632610 RepID=UPI003B982C99
MKRQAFLIVCAAFSLLAFSIAPHARAASLPEGNAPFHQPQGEQDIATVLRILAKDIGVSINIDSAVQGRLYRQAKPDGSARAFLDDICTQFGLVQYFDGQTLYITPSDKLRIEVFTFEKYDVETVIGALKQFDLYEPRFTHKYLKHGKILLVRAPEPYLKVLKQTFDALEKVDPLKVTVLRGSSGMPGLPYAGPVPPIHPDVLQVPQP